MICVCDALILQAVENTSQCRDIKGPYDFKTHTSPSFRCAVSVVCIESLAPVASVSTPLDPQKVLFVLPWRPHPYIRLLPAAHGSPKNPCESGNPPSLEDVASEQDGHACHLVKPQVKKQLQTLPTRAIGALQANLARRSSLHSGRCYYEPDTESLEMTKPALGNDQRSSSSSKTFRAKTISSSSIWNKHEKVLKIERVSMKPNRITNNQQVQS